MPREKTPVLRKFILAVLLISVIIVGILAGIYFKKAPPGDENNVEQIVETANKIKVPVKNNPVIDYNTLEKNGKSGELTEERKTRYGVGKGIDMIVREDESFKVGKTVVSMQEILENALAGKDTLYEKDLTTNDTLQGKKLREYGIYIVQPGDNIWNIHFKFLKDYFDHKTIMLTPLADEPTKAGCSSGVGKLLKFSERMVSIYNIIEHKVDLNLNMIEPMSKVIVYNMNEILALLGQIDYSEVDHLQFDGDTIWIPTEQ